MPAPPAAGAVAAMPGGAVACRYSAPPVRLRMTSADFLCQRSMLVRWCDPAGVEQSWSSSTEADGPEGGWFEAEKLLPSGARNISVQFQAHGPGGPWDVCQVDRRRDCCWVAPAGSRAAEVLRLRSDVLTVGDTVDALFELAGPMHGCYIWRAWNAAGAARHRPWEHWPDPESRPRPAGRPKTLDAADGAAPLLSAPGDPMVRCRCTTKRLSAAAEALVGVHRRTLEGLRALDTRFTDQWLGVNVGTTASAGLGIASAVLLFTAPPVGVSLGIGSTLTGGLAFAGDSLADHSHMTDLKHQLSQDAYDAFVVGELLKEWMHAKRSLASASSSGPSRLSRADSTMTDMGDWAGGRGSSADTFSLGEAVDNGLCAGAIADGVALTGSRLADGLGRTVAGFSQVLGVAGALITTGFMIRGWSTTKAGQATVREKIQELTLRVLQLQHLAASIDRLECAICADEIILADSVRRCSFGLHCFHARCLRSRGFQAGRRGCPECGGPLDAAEELLADSVEACQQQLHCGTQNARMSQEPLLAEACGKIGEKSGIRAAGRQRRHTSASTSWLPGVGCF